MILTLHSLLFAQLDVHNFLLFCFGEFVNFASKSIG